MGEWVGIEPFLKNFLCVCGRGGGCDCPQTEVHPVDLKNPGCSVWHRPRGLTAVLSPDNSLVSGDRFV